jgi:hypothetical protein
LELIALRERNRLDRDQLRMERSGTAEEQKGETNHTSLDGKRVSLDDTKGDPRRVTG